jgi:hypothetical protein
MVMLVEFSSTIDLLLGIGITFGLAFVFMLLTYKNFTSFMIWALVFSSFCAEAHLIPLWVFIALFIINIFQVGIEYSKIKTGSSINFEYLSLACLISLSVLNILFGGTWLGFSLEGTIVSSTTINNTFSIDPFWGLIGVIITIAIIGALFGIQLAGFGLSEQSVKMLIITITYVGLWGLFSILSFDLLMSIPIFGSIIWIILTIVYAVGVMKKFTGGEE